MTGHLLNVAEVAEQLRIHPETVREMARRREIASVRVGRGRTAAYRFERADVDAYLRARRKEATPLT